MSERQAGWYWVVIVSGTWEVAEWSHGRWWTLWDEIDAGAGDAIARDSDMHEIGDRIPTPDEPWQCVPREATREMLESTGDKSAEAYHGMLGAWTLMLAAAPKP